MGRIAGKISFWNHQERRRKTLQEVGFCAEEAVCQPIYPGLQTHEIPVLSKRYGMRVWQSYLENNNSDAMRMYWVYGPEQRDVTIIGLEPHPEDKKNGAYDRIKLSDVENKASRRAHIHALRLAHIFPCYPLAAKPTFSCTLRRVLFARYAAVLAFSSRMPCRYVLSAIRRLYSACSGSSAAITQSVVRAFRSP